LIKVGRKGIHDDGGKPVVRLDGHGKL
jgi:hypothetical protein